MSQYRDCPSDRFAVSFSISQPYQCVCVPSQSVLNLETSDVVSGLLKYNSNLTKYLSKYQGSLQSNQVETRKTQEEAGGGLQKDKRSIIEIYNLRLLPPGSHQLEVQNSKEVQQAMRKVESNNCETQTSPRNKLNQNLNEKKQKHKLEPNQEKIQKHLEQMAKSSRYLSNSGFKKYFGRQCFENYGRQNRSGAADGIVYNNYMKTFNISPHCGNNLPMTEETHRHSLIAGDKNNYKNGQIPQSHHGSDHQKKNIQGHLRKPVSNMQEVREEAEQYENQQNKYTVIEKQKDKEQYTGREIRHLKQMKKVLEERNKPLLHLCNPFKNEGYRKPQKNRKSLDKKEKSQEKGERRQESNNYNVENGESRRKQSNKNNLIQKEMILRVNKQEYYPNKGDENILLRQKKQILEKCYKNKQVGEVVSKYNLGQCNICRQRRFSKCCCK